MARILSNYRNVEPKMYRVGIFVRRFAILTNSKCSNFVKLSKRMHIRPHDKSSFEWILSNFIDGPVFANPIFDEDCEDVDECNETDPALFHDCDPNATCSNIGRDSQTR